MKEQMGWKSPPSSDGSFSDNLLHHSSHDANFGLGEQD
jgi:hypothetical protein